jgi:hypothetical protein
VYFVCYGGLIRGDGDGTITATSIFAVQEMPYSQSHSVNHAVTVACLEGVFKSKRHPSPTTKSDIQTAIENWHQKGVRIRCPNSREARMDSYLTDIVFVVVAILVFLLALRQKPKVEK